MCGIAGVFHHQTERAIDPQTLVNMAAIMHHRGPDGFGYEVQQDYGVGFSHARLSIIDLDEKRGRQPFISADKRLMLTHNGEFYDFKGIKFAPKPVQSIPIWVGGPSDAALRRAVRYGDAWHPIRMRMDWLKNTGIPRLNEIAAEEGRPVPALCPRVKLHVTGSPMPEGERVVGEGTLDQIHRDMAELEALGCDYVLLDTYLDDPEALRHPEDSWRVYAEMAEKVLDLGNQTVR